MSKKAKSNVDSRLELFSDFHLIKEKITQLSEKSGVLLCIDCSDKTRAGGIGLNLGIAYANDGINTLTFLSKNEAETAKQVLASSDRFDNEEATQTKIDKLSVQSISFVDNQSLSSLMHTEKIIRESKNEYEQIIIPINASKLPDQLLDEMILTSEQIVLIVSHSDTRWKAVNKIVKTVDSQNKKALGFVWID